MISRYTPKGAASKTLTYYVLPDIKQDVCIGFCAYDSQTSALIASSETLEELENKCTFLGYAKQIDKETK